MKQGRYYNYGCGCKVEYTNENNGISTVWCDNEEHAKQFCLKNDIICEHLTKEYLYKYYRENH